MSNQLTHQEIKELAEVWYRKLDVHAPMVEVLPMLSEGGLEMRFPEATLTTMAEFEGWYQRVIRIFFDEVHKVKEVTAEIDGDTAKVHVIVEWQASVWNPPAANSARIKLDADQSWVVKRSAVSGKPVISVYTVNSLNYHEGSAQL
jgi:hypothetical protein